MIQNAPNGKIYFGLHFYPGVAEYTPDDAEPFRVYLNEDALRAMDPSFAGKPVYLLHVDDDDIPATIDEARKEADGWVIRSFYNAADGKHWCEFMLLTQRAIDAVEQRGFRLSNAYRATHSIPAEGLWNGVAYQKEVKNGEYRHLALVPNPRYEESIVMTPEEFRVYNAAKLDELKNAKEGGSHLKLNIFKRAKVEKIDNAADFETLVVQLPKSKKEMTIIELVNAVDAEPGKPVMANMAHHILYGENTMSLNDFLAEHKKMADAYNELKCKVDNGDFTTADTPVPVSAGNAEDEDEDDDVKAKKKAEELAAHEQKEIDAKKDNALEDKRKKDAAKKKADELRNARETADDAVITVDLSVDQMERGRVRYGS